MDTLKYHDEELRQLFGQLPVEKPADGFSARVMTQVAFEAQRAARLKRMRLIAWAVSIPCMVILLLVSAFFTRDYWGVYLREYFEPLSVSLSNTASSITELFTGKDNRFYIPGLLFLALLLGDLFIKRYLERKKFLKISEI